VQLQQIINNQFGCLLCALAIAWPWTEAALNQLCHVQDGERLTMPEKVSPACATMLDKLLVQSLLLKI